MQEHYSVIDARLYFPRVSQYNRRLVGVGQAETLDQIGGIANSSLNPVATMKSKD